MLANKGKVKIFHQYCLISIVLPILWPLLIIIHHSSSLFLGASVVFVSADIPSSSSSCPKIRTSSNHNSERLKTYDPNGRFGFWETSGIALSYTQIAPSGEPILFTINDKGGGSNLNRLGVFDSGTGERLLTLRLSLLFPSGHDFESMTIGSCGDNIFLVFGSCLYLGDTGDNRARSSNGRRTGRRMTADGSRPAQPYRIYKLEEPIWTDYRDNENLLPSNHFYDILEFDYRHETSPRPYADSETLFMDYRSDGDLYLVTKWDRRETALTRLFHLPSSAWHNESGMVYSPQGYDGGEGSLLSSKIWTRGDMSSDGALIVLGDVNRVYLFERCMGTTVQEALVVQKECASWGSFQATEARKYETIAFTKDKTRTLQISECSTDNKRCNPPMIWTELEYNTIERICLDSSFSNEASTTVQQVGCFPGNSMVRVKGTGMVAMRDLKLGDMVLTTDDKYETIYSFGHYQPDQVGTFIRLTMSTRIESTNVESCTFDCNSSSSASKYGDSNDGTIVLTISPDHLLFVQDRGIIPASQIQVMDLIPIQQTPFHENYIKNSTITGYGRNFKFATVSCIESLIPEMGMYAPFTPSGKICVNDVITSCYVSLEQIITSNNTNERKLWSASWKLFGMELSYHWLSHAYTIPHRWKCQHDYYKHNGYALSSLFYHHSYHCINETYHGNTGLSEWVLLSLAWYEEIFKEKDRFLNIFASIRSVSILLMLAIISIADKPITMLISLHNSLFYFVGVASRSSPIFCSITVTILIWIGLLFHAATSRFSQTYKSTTKKQKRE